MAKRGYVGIESNAMNEWIVVKLLGTVWQCKGFKGSPAEMLSLMKFIREHCERPTIGLHSANCAVLRLLKYLNRIPGVEVVLLSDAGLRVRQGWLPERTHILTGNVAPAGRKSWHAVPNA